MLCLSLQRNTSTAMGATTTQFVVQTVANAQTGDTGQCQLVAFLPGEAMRLLSSADQVADLSSQVSALTAAGGAAGTAPSGDVAAFDPATAGAYFSFALVSTIVLWAVSHSAGQVISFIRRS